MPHTSALNPTPARRYCSIFISALLFAGLTACASSGGGNDRGIVQTSTAKVLVCKRGDTMVDSSRQCLQDDAACYQISTGKWCTGERGNVCPAGSTEIAAGSACPAGSRCIPFGESLTCSIPYRN